MGAVIFIAVIAAYIGAKIWYANWLTKGFRSRQIATVLPPDHVRYLFDEKVARTGWSLVDTHNPLVAQSGLLAGRRQQISLTIKGYHQGRLLAVIEVPRYWRKGFTPYKGHTLRLRMNAFLNAVSAADPHVAVMG